MALELGLIGSAWHGTGLTVTDGDPVGTGGGGGVKSIVGLLELTDVVVSDNTAFNGGGVLNVGQGSVVNLTRTTVIGNTSSSSGGGVYTDGLTTTNILDSTLSQNRGGDSGGIYSTGTSNLTNVTISGNTAEVDGGAATTWDSVPDPRAADPSVQAASRQSTAKPARPDVRRRIATPAPRSSSSGHGNPLAPTMAHPGHERATVRLP